jgi:hypothetical protein
LPKGITLHRNKHSLDNIKAAIKVNTELLDLYWQLGKEIIAKQNESNWVMELLSSFQKT